MNSSYGFAVGVLLILLLLFLFTGEPNPGDSPNVWTVLHEAALSVKGCVQ